MKKITLITFLIIFQCFLINKTFAETKTFTKKTGYNLYKHNIENFCKEYKNTDSSSELVYILDETSYFKEIKENNSKGLENAVKSYRKNMDEIYFCATNISFKRQIEIIKKELINKSPKLSAKMKKRLDKKVKEIEAKSKKLKGNCKINSNEKSAIIKKSILRQTTYELCKYNFYLQYLKEYNEKNIGNLKEGDVKDGISVSEVTNLFSEKQSKIQQEIEKSYRAFPLVFQSYSDFENNIGTHLLLELLREDFNTFREELHRTLNPINQVVYKISNAMRK